MHRCRGATRLILPPLRARRFEILLRAPAQLIDMPIRRFALEVKQYGI
jgi:hypothetical protein